MKEVNRSDLFKDFSKKELVNAIVNCIDSNGQIPLLKYLNENNEIHNQRVVNRILKDIESSKTRISDMEEVLQRTKDVLQNTYKIDSLVFKNYETINEVISRLNNYYQIAYAIENEKNILINLEQKLKEKQNEM